MTEREPFATPGPWIWTRFLNPGGTPITSKDQIKAMLCESVDKCEGLYLYGVTARDEGGEVVVCYTGNGPMSRNNAEVIANGMNAAVETRVKEEVKRAVEEFRERAALQCEKRAESLAVGTAVANQCARGVRSLPTEPEVEK